jgi:hypothetical protein
MKKPMNAILQTLYQLAKHNGVTVCERARGHFQLQGKLLVNYYPMSKSSTAYVAGTTQGRKHVSMLQAIEMANEAPPIASKHLKDERRKNTRDERQKLFRGHTWVYDVAGSRFLDARTYHSPAPGRARPAE